MRLLILFALVLGLASCNCHDHRMNVVPQPGGEGIEQEPEM